MIASEGPVQQIIYNSNVCSGVTRIEDMHRCMNCDEDHLGMNCDDDHLGMSFIKHRSPHTRERTAPAPVRSRLVCQVTTGAQMMMSFPG